MADLLYMLVKYPAAIVAVISAVVGFGFAYWRCRTADRNLRHQQYLTGSKLLNSQVKDRGLRYRNRVDGTATLARLMKEDPDQYDVQVVNAFEIFLSHPPVFSGDFEGHRSNETDYESRDTVEAVRALCERPPKRKKEKPPRLWPSGGGFMVTNDGDVIPDPSHEHYKRWVEVKGQAPNY